MYLTKSQQLVDGFKFLGYPQYLIPLLGVAKLLSDMAPRAAVEPWVSDPEYRRGAVDLLGILAYGALAAFDRLAEDAGHAPTLPDKVHMASMAALADQAFRDRPGATGGFRH